MKTDDSFVVVVSIPWSVCIPVCIEVHRDSGHRTRGNTLEDCWYLVHNISLVIMNITSTNLYFSEAHTQMIHLTLSVVWTIRVRNQESDLYCV